MTKPQILNPFLYIFHTPFYTLIYVPYKHNFIKLSNDEFELLKKGDLSDKDLKKFVNMRLLVEKDYKKKFLKHYRKLLPKKPRLNLMYLLITDACNFACPYCFIENNYSTVKRKIMSWDIAKKAIDYFLKHSKGPQRRIIFYGGEPTLNKDVLIKSLLYIHDKDPHIEIGINSNGSNFDESLAETIKKCGAILSISLDSFPEINKYTRLRKNGMDATKTIEQNIKLFLERGVFVTLSITLNSYNLPYLPSFAKYVCEKFPQIKSVGFNLSLENKKGNFLFADPEFSALQIYNSFRIFRKYGVYEDRVMRRLKHIIEENIYLQDCGACGYQIAVSPDNFVGPCHGFVGMKKDFVEFNESFDFYNSKIIEYWSKLSPITNPSCTSKNCPFILICGNSCPYYSYITKNSLKEVDERMCKFLPIFITEIGKDLTINKQIKNIIVDFDGTLVSRKPVKEILEEIKKKVDSSYEIKEEKYYDIREIIWKIVEKSPRKEEGEELVNNLIYLYLKSWKKESSLNYPLLEQLKKLKETFKVNLVIWSNNQAKEIEKELGQYANLFSEIYGKDNLDIEKGSKQTSIKFFKALDLDVEETAYVGDSFELDIKPLWLAGVRLAISFYANPKLFHRLNNNWLVDIVEDANNLAKKYNNI